MGTERSPGPGDSASRQQRAEKAIGRTAAMNGQGKSDECVVPVKSANEDQPLWVWAKEQAEGRRSAKRNSDQDTTSRAQHRKHGVSPVLAWVREKARKDKKAKFTSLYHHLDPSKLRHSFRAAEARRGTGSGRRSLEGVPGAQGRAAEKPVRSTASRNLSSEACATGLHPEAGWSAAPAGHRRLGGQNRPRCGGRGVERHLRGGLHRLLLRVPYRDPTASSATT